MATVEFMQPVTAEVAFLQVEAGVRYWEDGEVNGVSDEDGKLMPFASAEVWRPLIDLDNGTIVDWPNGTTAKVHYKVCDAGVYTLLSPDRKVVRKIDGYVPQMLSPGGSGYGDYIIMSIGPDGKIAGWQVDLGVFEDCPE